MMKERSKVQGARFTEAGLWMAPMLLSLAVPLRLGYVNLPNGAAIGDKQRLFIH